MSKIQKFITKLFRQSKSNITFFYLENPKQLKLMLIMVKPPQITRIE